MGHDPVRYALWVGGIGLAVTVVCGGYIAWINGASRNLALGLGALIGACAIFVLQILFELKGSSASSDFAMEFVIDYQHRSVRSARVYDHSMAVASSSRNLLIETRASELLARTTAPLTKEDAPKIARDLGVASIISYLLDEQSDWQLETRSIKTSTGTATQTARLSRPEECSSISMGEIQTKLRAVDNMFSGVQSGLMGSNASLCLPPHAELDITQSSVAIRTRVYSIVFALQEPFSSMSTIDPHAVALARASRQPIEATINAMPDGSPRYITIAISTRTTVELSRFRAQDRELDKYQRWIGRVAEGVKPRFEWPE